MKKIFSIMLVGLIVFAAASCKKDKLLDPNAKIYLTGKVMTKSVDYARIDSIVRTCDALAYKNEEVSNQVIERGWADHQRDVANHRLLMYGTDIIDQNGNYETEFINSHDIIFIANKWVARDTVAYIPNSVIEAARVKIKAAYDRGDYSTCYSLFHDAFYFIPITGSEYRELEKQGKN